MERALLWLLLSVTCATASAGQLSVLVNGHAMHLEESPKEKNEANYGVGLQYDAEPRRDWVWFAFGSEFEDSRKDLSYNFGGGVRKRYMLLRSWDLHADIGAAAMIMTRKSFNDGEPFPVALPIASLGTQRVAVNMAYIPEVDPKIIPLVFFQFMYALE